VVSVLSPFVSRRLLLEEELLQGLSSKLYEKWWMEVLWRIYWRGYLSHHAYLAWEWMEVLRKSRPDLDSKIECAVRGTTGVRVFDLWNEELLDTGYLHNHARMAYASIWVFRLGLPWQWGAWHFFKHLLDADIASNTLSWRWVAGLHTAGKTYIPESRLLESFTEGRMNPISLPPQRPPETLTAQSPYPHTPLKIEEPPKTPYHLVLTPDDHYLEGLLSFPPSSVSIFQKSNWDPLFQPSQLVRNADQTALEDSLVRLEERFGKFSLLRTEPKDPQKFAIAPLPGPMEDLTSRSSMNWIRRPIDQVLFPLASGGFFSFKKQAFSRTEELLSSRDST
jgi:deoxyribodipyrimidine photo-lyase